MPIAEIILLATAAYAGIGVVFAIVFVTVAMKRLEPSAADGPVLFKLIILPAAAALWPYLAARMVRTPRPAPAADTSEGATP